VSAYSDDEDEDDNQQIEEVGPNEAEVQGFLAQGRNVDALKSVLSNAPVNTKNQQVKDKALQLVMRVLLSFKTSEIKGAVQTLEPTSVDMLMKYIYRGFEVPSEGSSLQLLNWHEQAFASGGLGSIVRTLTDRKRV